MDLEKIKCVQVQKLRIRESRGRKSLKAPSDFLSSGRKPPVGVEIHWFILNKGQTEILASVPV